jgi:hypothetical protein
MQAESLHDLRRKFAGTARPDCIEASWPKWRSVLVATADVQQDVPGDGNCLVSGDASAGAGRAEAEHYGAARYSCCRVPFRTRPRAANGREPRIPD